jgi:hypothetical protein
MVTAEMEQEKRTGIQSLPPELLDEIFNLLIQPPPSVQRLHDQPSHDITHSKSLDLKSISYVSRRWRQSVLPIVFQHARVVLPMEKFQTNWPIELEDFLAFVRRNHLEANIHSFTLVVQDHMFERTSYYFDESHGSLNNYWSNIFSVIDPVRLAIVAPYPILAYLAGLRVDGVGLEDPRVPYQVLSLEHSSLLSRESQNGGMISDAVTLLDLRPWHSLLINEGSYNHCRIGNGHHPRSIINGLIQAQFAHPPPLPQTIKSLSYIALHPPSVYGKTLASSFFKHIQRIYLQILPPYNPFPDNSQQDDPADDPGRAEWYPKVRFYRLLMHFSSRTPEAFNLVLNELICGDKAVNDAVKETLVYYQGCWREDPARVGVYLRDKSKMRRAYDSGCD